MLPLAVVCGLGGCSLGLEGQVPGLGLVVLGLGTTGRSRHCLLYTNPKSNSKVMPMLQIAVAESMSAVQAAVGDAADVLSVLGSLRPVRDFGDRDALVHSAVSYYLLGRVMPACAQ